MNIASKNLVITICYDNYPHVENLATEWGFSCLVTGGEKTVLFDTGGSKSALLGNMGKLGIDIKDIDIIVLSHIHGDHVGGLRGVLESNSDVAVYMPASFPRGFKEEVVGMGAEVVEVTEPVEICKGFYSTGEMGEGIIEQSLLVDTDKGAGVITGCAHPGIVGITRKAKEITGGDLLFALGGFHLLRKDKASIEGIVAEFRKLGVRYAGPSHCSGDQARKIFAKEYGEKYLGIGVGKVLNVSEM